MAEMPAPSNSSVISNSVPEPVLSLHCAEERKNNDADMLCTVPASLQAPGGTSTICIASDLAAPMDTRCGSVSSNRFACAANQNSGNTITDRSTTRLHQAPGGTSTLCLGDEDSTTTPIKHLSTKPVVSEASQDGGDPMEMSTSEKSAMQCGNAADTHKHDESVSANRFACGSNPNCDNIITDRPTTRLHQVPGGISTISLGSHDTTVSSNERVEQGFADNVEMPIVRRPIGGPTTISVGSESSVDIFAEILKDREADIATPAAAPRFSQAPGGTASIPLGNVGGPAGLVADTPALTRPVGGEDTIILGGEYPAEAFIHNANEKLREAGMETLAPLPRFSQEPGGNTSIALGGNYPEDCLVAETFVVKGPVGGVASVARASVSRRTPESQVADENVDMSNMVVQQPQGGSQTPKPVTVKRQMGGGAISVILG